MSDHNDERVPEGMGKSDAERREFGRQVAMDSILTAAQQGKAGASHSQDEVAIPQLSSHRGGQHWSRMAAVAAVVIIGSGAWLWLGSRSYLPANTPMRVGARDMAKAGPASSEVPAVSTTESSKTRVLDFNGHSYGQNRSNSSHDQADEEAPPQGETKSFSKTQDPIKTQSLSKSSTASLATQPGADPAAQEGKPASKTQPIYSTELHYKEMAKSVRRMKEAPEELRIPRQGVTVVLDESVLRDQLTANSKVYNLHVAKVARTDMAGAPQANPPRLVMPKSETLTAAGRFFNGGESLTTFGFAGGGGGGGSVKLNSESYDSYIDNAFAKAKDVQLSTFSIDVDTASYSNIRDLLKRGQKPTPDAVRIEELINYFDYKYAGPEGEHPLAIHVDMARAPWAPDHHLVRIGLQARKPLGQRPQANLVFLIDVSGSMSPDNKLPLLKRSMKRLVAALKPNDRIAIVVYAGAAGMALDSTEVNESDAILAALQKLKSGGSTNGGAGIELAYKIAQKHFVDGGINRVILASDGDFNVGVSDRSSLIKMIEEKRDTGIFLSVLGFGRGNLKDSQMEQIANKGNGTYHYIDSLREGHRVLVRKLDSSLVTVAKDVKIQVEFNPAIVRSYRLIGYANRMLKKEDFNNDTKDAGEIGSGHTVTALYEVVTIDAPEKVDALRYGQNPGEKPADHPSQVNGFGDEMMFVKVRYKQPDGSKSILLDTPFAYSPTAFAAASEDFRFAAAVASFGMVLRNSNYKGTATLASILEIAEGAMGDDEDGYRNEFLQLLSPLQEQR